MAKSKGLGDTVAKFTEATGIDKVVNYIEHFGKLSVKKMLKITSEKSLIKLLNV